MTDLDITIGTKEELPPPSDDDKRLVDNIKNLPPTPVEEHEPADDLEEGGMTFEPSKEEDGLEPKEVIDQKKIFKQDEEEEPIAEAEPPPPKVKKIKQATEKQREHLKKAREKALATRRKNAAARKILADEKKAERDAKRKEKELKIISKEDREYKQKQKQKDIPQNIGKSFTEEQIIDLQQKAIENYEVKRKARKEVKKKEQQKVAQDKKTYDMINNAINPDPEDVWASCFQ
jgi:hypothetical protein